MTAALVVLSSFVASLLLLALILNLAGRFELLAHPNARSSHLVATPTVGGIAIVVPIVILLAILSLNGNGSEDGMMLRLLIAVSFLALIGFLDDLKGLGAGARLLCQAASVALMVEGFGLSVPLFWLAVIGFLLLWHVNLFNFMDGIDGIAAVQTLLYCVGVLLLADGVPGGWGLLLWTIGGASIGFLAYNWPPARIFIWASR